MLAGPPASSFLFQKYGGKTMLFHLSGLWAAFVLLSIIFLFDDPAARKKRPAAAAAG